jgi:hypothetical protein
MTENVARTATAEEDPRTGSSLVPMLVGGLLLIIVGMFVAVAFS